MKKLLSILAISGVIGMSSSTVISCGDDTNAKVDFPTLTLPQIGAGNKIYDSVREAIASQARNKDGKAIYANASAVEEDKQLGIAIYIKDGKGLGQDATAENNTEYTVKIVISDSNEHFNQKDVTPINTKGVTKVDFPTLNLDGLAADDNLYDFVRTAISNQVKSGETKLFADKDAVKADNNLGISIWEKDGSETKPLAQSAKADASKEYIAKISIGQNDNFIAKSDVTPIDFKVGTTPAKQPLPDSLKDATATVADQKTVQGMLDKIYGEIDADLSLTGDNTIAKQVAANKITVTVKGNTGPEITDMGTALNPSLSKYSVELKATTSTTVSGDETYDIEVTA